jgi:hypothetical protein
MTEDRKMIRNKFNEYFHANNEAMIAKFCQEYPWLMEDMEAFDSQAKPTQKVSREQAMIVAAVGVMSDENSGEPCGLNDVTFSIRADFKQKMDDASVLSILKSVEALRLIKKEQSGYTLTPEGEKICDDFLNAQK